MPYPRPLLLSLLFSLLSHRVTHALGVSILEDYDYLTHRHQLRQFPNSSQVLETRTIVETHVLEVDCDGYELPDGWSDLGCFVDSMTKRTLTDQVLVVHNTPNACITACSSKGFNFAGVEYGSCLVQLYIYC